MKDILAKVRRVNARTHYGIPYVVYRKSAEGILGAVDWVANNKGHLKCPYGHRVSSDKEGTIFLNHRGMLYHCYHVPCLSAEVINKRLSLENNRIARGSRNVALLVKAANNSSSSPFLRASQYDELQQLSKNEFPVIVRNWKWSYADMVNDSPRLIPADMTEHWSCVVKLFQPGDVIWMGRYCDSGQQKHKACFRTRDEWLRCRHVSGPLTCPATFTPGGYSRSQDAVIERRFLIMESDRLSYDDAGAIINWFHKGVGMTLRCIVDTGGKSLHAWFDYPRGDFMEAFKIVLPELGFDTAMLRPAQCTRLPGVLRPETRHYQKLIYLA